MLGQKSEQYWVNDYCRGNSNILISIGYVSISVQAWINEHFDK